MSLRGRRNPAFTLPDIVVLPTAGTARVGFISASRLTFPAPTQPTSIARVQTSSAVPTTAPRQGRSLPPAVGILPLLLALGAAAVMYWPALGSGFWNDDYIYLVAARTIPLGHYVHDSIVPGSTDPTLHFAQAFWRPLYFISFPGLNALFGAHPLGYHVVVFAIHLVGIAVVWALAWRLTRSLAGAGVAAVVFAVFPVGYDAVTWVSSLNSAAFPLALGSWLVFTFAVDERPARQRVLLHAAAVLLLIAALGFRENTLSLAGTIGLWYLLCHIEPREMLDWRAWLPLVPYAVLSIAYLTFRTIAAPAWLTPDPIFKLGFMNVRETWYYIKLAPLPFLELGGGWPETAREVAAVLFLLCIPLSIVLRRWLIAVLLVSFVLAVLPFSVVTGVTGAIFLLPFDVSRTGSGRDRGRGPAAVGASHSTGQGCAVRRGMRRCPGRGRGWRDVARAAASERVGRPESAARTALAPGSAPTVPEARTGHNAVGGWCADSFGAV